MRPRTLHLALVAVYVAGWAVWSGLIMSEPAGRFDLRGVVVLFLGLAAGIQIVMSSLLVRAWGKTVWRVMPLHVVCAGAVFALGAIWCA